MTPSYRKSNRHFDYNNANPKNIKTAGDCVIRAISIATGEAWEFVFEDLCDVALHKNRMPNDTTVFSWYLEKTLRWTKCPQPRNPDNTKVMLVDFCRQCNPNQVYIISVANHLTCVKGRKIQDTWDCGEKCVGNYWIPSKLKDSTYRF